MGSKSQFNAMENNSNEPHVDMYTVLMKERLRLLRMQTIENMLALQQYVKIQKQLQQQNGVCFEPKNFLGNDALSMLPTVGLQDSGMLPLTHLFTSSTSISLAVKANAPIPDNMLDICSGACPMSSVEHKLKNVLNQASEQDFTSSSSMSSSISIASTDCSHSEPETTPASIKRKRDAGDLDGSQKQRLKICQVLGCMTQDKGGGFCAKHGGGKPCATPGCERRVAGTKFCSEHGGSRKKRCSHEGCAKGDQGGGFCAAHGGGRRCQFEGCDRRSVGNDLCWAHGGGKRCKFDGCKKSPKTNGFCLFHQE